MRNETEREMKQESQQQEANTEVVITDPSKRTSVENISTEILSIRADISTANKTFTNNLGKTRFTMAGSDITMETSIKNSALDKQN